MVEILIYIFVSLWVIVAFFDMLADRNSRKWQEKAEAHDRRMEASRKRREGL